MIKVLLHSLFTTIICVALSFSSYSQKSDYHQIPDSYKSHPEYGVLKMDDNPNTTELIHLRTKNSRTFADQSGNYYSVSTAGTFHYKDSENRWISIQDKISKNTNHEYGIFQSELPIKINYRSGKTEMLVEKKGSSITFGENSSLQYVAKNGLVVENYLSNKTMGEPRVAGNQLSLKDFLPGLNRVQELEYWSVRTDYFIEQKLNIPSDAAFLQITDELILPANWKIEYGTGEMTTDGWNGDLLIVNQKGGVVSTISKPLYYDSFKSKNKNEVGSHLGLGSYKLTKTITGYTIQLLVPTSWLNQEDLVYPLVIDPTTTNTYALNYGLYELSGYNATCQVDMDLNFPPTGGYVVTGTNTNYRIWAKGFIYSDGFTSNYADKTEQQSRVGSVNGWSATQAGSGTNHLSTDPNYFTPANNGQDYPMNNLTIANGCYNDRATIPYHWQGYQTFFPHSAGPPQAQQMGCSMAYQELVTNTWIVTATYNLATVVTTPVSISYPNTTFCASITSVQVTQTGVTGGVYSAVPAGLSINAATGEINPSASTPGTYTVKYLVGTPPCSSQSTKIVTILNYATPTFAQVGPICLGVSYTLPSNSTNTLSVPGTWSPAIDATATTTYTFTPNAGQCASTTTMTVAVSSISLVSTSSPSTCGIVSGSVSVLASGGIAPYMYAWSPAIGTTATVSNLDAGTYNVTVTDAAGCSKNETATVIVIDPPVVVLASKTDVNCYGASNGSATISVTGGLTPYSYVWTPSGGNSLTTNNLSAGNYSVVVTDASGCVANTQFEITQPTELMVTTTGTESYCGKPVGSANALASGGTGNYSYSWSPGNGSGAGLSNLSPGNYVVTVTDANGCSKIGMYTVVLVGNIPVSATPPLSIIAEGGAVNLFASSNSNIPGTTYSWSPTTGLSCTDCPNPIATPENSTNYVVTMTTPDGCVGKDTAKIVVKIICGEFFIPTIFSPNGDGVNDDFRVYGKCIVGMDLKIYDRWGEVVFETTNHKAAWDGNYKGEPLNPGSFIYMVNLSLADGTFIKQNGNINLVR